jgi:hypothetical protein
MEQIVLPNNGTCHADIHRSTGIFFMCCTVVRLTDQSVSVILQHAHPQTDTASTHPAVNGATW